MQSIFKQYRDRVQRWSIEKANGPHATPFLALTSFAESVFFPIPIDIFLVPLVIVRAKSWIYYTVVASIASIVGGVVGYFIGLFSFTIIGVHIVSFYGLESEVALVNA